VSGAFGRHAVVEWLAFAQSNALSIGGEFFDIADQDFSAMCATLPLAVKGSARIGLVFASSRQFDLVGTARAELHDSRWISSKSWPHEASKSYNDKGRISGQSPSRVRQMIAAINTQ